MAISLEALSGGLAAEKDLVLPGRPDDPEMRESMSIWMVEENGAFAFPRGGIECEGQNWFNRRVQGNFAFPDGRVMVGASEGPAFSPFGPDGRPIVIGAGPLLFRCIEPFRRWSVVWDGPALDGTVEEQIARTYGPKGAVPVRLAVELEMATPAWIQEYSEADAIASGTADAAAAMGFGYRFEHLFRATGRLTLDGATRDFKATGLRIHRQSIRRLEGFVGHCWQSALFPDGRAFGTIAYPARDDGTPPYNIGFVYQDGTMYPARSVEPPFLRRLVREGDDVSLTLESEIGLTRIEGVTTMSTFRVGNPDVNGLDLQQAAVRYRWGDQTAFGMLERSSDSALTAIG